MSVLMTLSDLERRDSDLLNNTRTFDPNDQIGQDNTCGSGVFLEVIYAPTARGRGPSAAQFGGFPSIYAHTI